MPAAVDMSLEGSGLTKETIPNAFILLKADNFTHNNVNYQIADGTVAQYSTDNGQTWNWVRVYKGIHQWVADASFLTWTPDQSTFYHHCSARNGTDIQVWCSATIDENTTSNKGEDNSDNGSGTSFVLGFAKDTSNNPRNWETDIYVNNEWIRKKIVIQAAEVSILKVRFSGSPDFDVEFAIADNRAKAKWDKNKYYRRGRSSGTYEFSCFKTQYVSVQIKNLQMMCLSSPNSYSYGVNVNHRTGNSTSGGAIIYNNLLISNCIILARIGISFSGLYTNTCKIVLYNNIIISALLPSQPSGMGSNCGVIQRNAGHSSYARFLIANNFVFGFDEVLEMRPYSGSSSTSRLYNNICIASSINPEYVPYLFKCWNDSEALEVPAVGQTYSLQPIWASNLSTGRYTSADDLSLIQRTFNSSPEYPPLYKPGVRSQNDPLIIPIIQQIQNQMLSLYDNNGDLVEPSSFDFSFLGNIIWPSSLLCLDLNVIQQSPYSYPCYNPAADNYSLTGTSDTAYKLATESWMIFDTDITGKTRTYWTPGPVIMKTGTLKKRAGQFGTLLRRSEFGQFM